MSAPDRIDPRQIEEIKARVSIDSVIGRVVKLRKAGRRFTGLCPFHSEKTASFSVSPDHGFYHCFGCGAHGGVIDFVMATQGIGFVEAVKALADDGGVSLDAPPSTAFGGPPPRAGEDQGRRGDRQVVDSATAGRWLWRASVPARGTIVERWLEARGLDLGAFGLGDGIGRLRFLADAPAAAWRVDEDPRRFWLRAPAMIAPVSDGEGHVRAVHVTYLARDGRSKAVFPALPNGDARGTRKMYGPVGGRAVWLSGLPYEGSGRPLIVGEGIETCWSYVQRLGLSARVAAALSLENLQGGAKKLACRDGSAWRLWRIEAELERPPFLIERAGEVTVLVDADMKPLRHQLVQRERRGPIERADISQGERAEICAALATQHWRAAGAAPVQAMRPPMGMDFNDAVRRSV